MLEYECINTHDMVSRVPLLGYVMHDDFKPMVLATGK